MSLIYMLVNMLWIAFGLNLGYYISFYLPPVITLTFMIAFGILGPLLLGVPTHRWLMSKPHLIRKGRTLVVAIALLVLSLAFLGFVNIDKIHRIINHH